MRKIVTIIVVLIMVNLSFGQTQNKTCIDKSLIAQLDTIHQEDQKYRLRINELLMKSRSESENMELITLHELMNEKDSINLIAVEKILNEHGWLGADVIGKQGNKTLFLVIQHSDLETQLKYLPVMREALTVGNINSTDFAQLEDRIAKRQGNRQIYGTQIVIDGDEFYVYPIIEPEKVNERRAVVGLPPIEDYVKNAGITWNVEKHKEKTKEIESKKEE
jgi:hypothetical protein